MANTSRIGERLASPGYDCKGDGTVTPAFGMADTTGAPPNTPWKLGAGSRMRGHGVTSTSQIPKISRLPPTNDPDGSCLVIPLPELRSRAVGGAHPAPHLPSARARQCREVRLDQPYHRVRSRPAGLPCQR